MNAFIKLNRGMLKMPIPSRIWLMLLVTADMVGDEELAATDPSTVSLVTGEPQVIEFFAFW